MTAKLPLVNPFAGSDSSYELSTGNLYPIVGVPWGGTYWSPQTAEDAWFYQRRPGRAAGVLQGIRATHQPSPWMRDWGHFTLMPVVGEVGPEPARWASSYRLDEEQAGPDRYKVRLLRYDIGLELTATARCGLLRIDFAGAGDPAVMLRLRSGRASFRGGKVVGYSDSNDSAGCVEGLATHFVVEGPIKAVRNFDGGVRIELDRTPAKASEPSDDAIVLKIGMSFIGTDQAEVNLAREVGDLSFDEVRKQTAEAWERELSRVEVRGGTERQRRTFYTCLYRALLWPQAMHEPTDDGPRHFSPFDGQVHDGVMYAGNGFWDTHRTVYPLLALAWPRKYGEIVQGWVNAARQGGWFPRWSAPGYAACMVGTHLAAVVADAVARGIGGFDVEAAYAAMRRDAIEPGDERGRWGRQGLPFYHEHGYVDDDAEPDSVARTLDYAYNDWCCSQVAAHLGRGDDAALFAGRAGNWRNVFDPVTKFTRPRGRDGAFKEPFDPYRWGGPYVEGGPWQYRFCVPHDPEGFAEAMGGVDALVSEIERMVAEPPRFHVGSYPREIHEMTEMAATDFGQYAHSNQPVHGVLWLPARLGRPDVTDRLVRRVLDELYSPDGYCGDEDNGEMAAWYVLASLGRFPQCPGDGRWTATPMLWDGVTIAPDSEERKSAMRRRAAKSEVR